MSTFLWLVLIGGVLMVCVYPTYAVVSQWYYKWQLRKSARWYYPCRRGTDSNCAEDCPDCYK